MTKLTWKTIYYHEELDTDGSILYIECTQEAEYRTGYLVKTVYDQTYAEDFIKVRTESVTFAPK